MIPAWLRSATAAQRRVLAAAALGWMLDSMDVMLYAMVLPYVARDLHMGAAFSGGLMSCTLIAAAVGGILFGRFADRFGRTRALSASMALYSVGTALCGLTHTALALAACRLLLGLGMGGEWASGAALVSESFPAAVRSRALAFMQSFWALGYALGAVVTAVILPHFGWRAVFFAGLAPALVTLWVRHAVQESSVWQQQRQPTRFSELFSTSLRSRTVITTTMNAATLFAWWGLFTWTPRFLSLPVAQGGHGLSIVNTSAWTIVMQLGTFAGYLSFGALAARLGQKRTYIGFLLIAALSVPLFTSVRSTAALLIVGPVVGFFGTGYFSGFAYLASEIFPTHLRATAMGFVYNLGRIASAAAPYTIGALAEHYGLAAAMTITSLGFALAALIATQLTEPQPST